MQYLHFSLDESRFALSLESVQSVVRAVEPTLMPSLPEIVIGVVNFHGTIIPLVNLRRRFGHPDRGVHPDDRFILARTRKRPVALLVDQVEGLREHALEEIIPITNVVPGNEYIQGLVKLGDEVILIHDLDSFLSLDEVAALDRSMPTGDGGG